jgi:hypothetical protein
MRSFKISIYTSSILITLLFITGCTPPNNEELQAKKDLRIELFEKCMKLLPEGPKETHYNDWSEVIKECGTQAYYMSR